MNSFACFAIGAAAAVLLATFGLTLIEDLTFGIIAGCVLAAAFALSRSRQAVATPGA